MHIKILLAPFYVPKTPPMGIKPVTQTLNKHFYYHKRVLRKYFLSFLKKLLLFFLKSIRMSRKKINFDYKILEKNDFYENKKVFNIDDIDVNKY